MKTETKMTIEYRIEYLTSTKEWRAGACYLDPDEALENLSNLAIVFPSQQYRVVRRVVTEEIISQTHEN